MNDVVDIAPAPAPGPLFGRLPVTTNPAANVGAIEVESQRAIAETQAQIMIAKRFPRVMASCINEMLETCKSTEFAQAAFYSVPNRGSGPSIRFAEEAARCYGNFEYGHIELSRGEGKSEVEVYAWDKERNNRSRRQITVLHVVDTKNGPRKLHDQADIDNRIANVASKMVRGRIMALMPKHMVAMAVAACKLTLAGGNEAPLTDRIAACKAAFGKMGVTADRLKAYLGHAVEECSADDLADLMGVRNAIKEGAALTDFFPDAAAKTGTTDTAERLAELANAARAGSVVTAPTPPAPTRAASPPPADVDLETGEVGPPVAADSAPPPPPATAATRRTPPPPAQPARAAAPTQQRTPAPPAPAAPPADDAPPTGTSYF